MTAGVNIRLKLVTDFLSACEGTGHDEERISIQQPLFGIAEQAVRRIAIRRRRDEAGFVGGVLLGPVGIMLALASSRDEGAATRREDERRLKSGEFIRCPHCLEIVRAGAKVCPHCQREIEAVSSPAPEPQASRPRVDTESAYDATAQADDDPYIAHMRQQAGRGEED